MTLHWSSKFIRSFKKRTKAQPELRGKILHIMRILERDPFAVELKTHKLKGMFEGTWACSVEYDFRIIFEFVKNPVTAEKEILLIDIGTHEEVY
ncbi:MAG: type II toxin-antitoxin system mRNA interferase toxin, RelE/StbE family [Ignavibacteriales bacterium]|nr:type II toxin-antitoxin system mRNA interferase toxin, RelE/StbE family [Ignavibacteriales bacterium]